MQQETADLVSELFLSERKYDKLVSSAKKYGNNYNNIEMTNIAPTLL